MPQFYLNYFCSDGTLWIYEKGLAQPHLQTPRNTAVEAHLYSFTVDGQKHDYVEQQLSVIESEAKTILDRWQQRAAVPYEEERQTVAMFLALLHVRVPRMISAIAEGMEIVVTETAKLTAELRPDVISSMVESKTSASGWKPPSTEEMIDKMKNFEDHFRVKVNREASVAESLKLAPKIVPDLLDRNWSLWDAPSGKFFVTGDTPLCVFAPTRPGKAFFGAGYDLPGAEITFPIAARTCLMLSRGNHEPRRSITVAELRVVNTRMVATAERYVFSPAQSSAIGRMTSQAQPNQPKLDREVFASEWRRRFTPKMKLD